MYNFSLARLYLHIERIVNCIDIIVSLKDFRCGFNPFLFLTSNEVETLFQYLISIHSFRHEMNSLVSRRLEWYVIEAHATYF